MVRQLTIRQEEVLGFILECLGLQGYPPTLREIAGHFGMASVNAARDHLRALEAKGYLRREADKSRALIVTPRGRAAAGTEVSRGGSPNREQLSDRESPPRGLPLIGEVAAGTPIMAEQNHQDVVNLGDYFGRDPGTFVLRVKGESMTGAGIRPGDLVVVHHQPTLDSGDIGVAYLGQEATVKRVFIEADHIRLQPENDQMSPTFVSRDDPDFRIGGKVIGVIRKL
jgi:repressor LexA